MATLRKTTCKEKKILQSWWPQFTHIVLRCLNQIKELKSMYQVDEEPVLTVQTHCFLCSGPSPCFCQEELSCLGKQPSVGGGSGGGGAAIGCLRTSRS